MAAVAAEVAPAGATPTATNDPAAKATPARTPTSFLMAEALHETPRGEGYRWGVNRDAVQEEDALTPGNPSLIFAGEVIELPPVT